MVCEHKRQLLADYLERVQALSIRAEVLLDTLEKNSDGAWSQEWYRMEQARISCDIARLALGNHTTSHGC
jgi:hypothetical protein